MTSLHNFTEGAALNKPLPALDYEQLERLVPAAFADGPAPTTSGQYNFISTKVILEDLHQRGYYPVRASQPKSKDPFCTHTITMRRAGEDLVVGDIIPEVMLTNSHNALRSFSLTAGLFRLACSNGLLVSFAAFGYKASQTHIGRNNLDNQLTHVIENLDMGMARLPAMRERLLSSKEEHDLAYQAASIREGGHLTMPKYYDLDALLTIRRDEDREPSLWSVFNRLQENIIRGGVAGPTRDLRPITQVDRAAKINKELWEAALTYLN